MTKPLDLEVVPNPSLIQQPYQDVCILRPVSSATHPKPHAAHQLLFRGKTRTFKPRKDIPEGTKQYQLRKYAEATLVRWRYFVAMCIVWLSSGCVQGSGNLRLAVQLPDGEDTNEWLAVHGTSPAYLISYCSSICSSPLGSRRFLQPPEHALRHNHRVLYPTRGPSALDVCHPLDMLC